MKRFFVSFVFFVSPLAYAGDGVTFVATGNPGFLTINGQCEPARIVAKAKKCLDGKPCNDITAEVQLASCKTGIGMRDGHMLGYLHATQFPKAVFKGIIPEEGPFAGELTVNGKSARVEGSISNGAIEFKTHITNHGVDLPSFMGVTVMDEVTVKSYFKR